MAQLAEQTEALGDDVVLVDRLEVLLARMDEGLLVEIGVRAERDTTMGEWLEGGAG